MSATLTPQREKKLKNTIRRKQPNLTLVFDNVTDPHNIYACLRTADSVGVMEVFIIHTGKVFEKKEKEGKRSASSAKKWMRINFFTDHETCFKAVKQRYDKIYGTYLGEAAVDLYEMDLTDSVALVFGNEQEGLSEEAKAFCDGQFLIPQVGMIESLNISVACAVTLYEAYRQRKLKGYYDDKPLMSEQDQSEMFERWSQL